MHDKGANTIQILIEFNQLYQVLVGTVFIDI